MGFEQMQSIPISVTVRISKLRPTLRSKRPVNFINATYAPTLRAVEEAKEKFHSDLRNNATVRPIVIMFVQQSHSSLGNGSIHH